MQFTRMVAVGCLMVGTASPAFAQLPGPDPALGVQDSTYAPRYRFSPVFINAINADVSSVGMASDFRTGLTTPWGSTFDFGIRREKKEYRLNSNFDETKVLRLSDAHVFNPFLFGTAAYADSRVFNRSVAVGGGFQDFIINDQTLSLNSVYRRTLDGFGTGGLRADMQGTAGAIKSERAFKNDSGLQAGANGGVAYDIGDRLTWIGRGALRATWDESETSQQVFSGLGSNEDSLATAVNFEAADSISFNASYRQYDGERVFTDQARGSGGVQDPGAENVIKETENRTSRVTALRLNSRVMRGLVLDLTATHDEQVLDYAVQTTRYSRTVLDGVMGNIRYRFPWRSTTSTLTFETNQTLRDLGPTSLSSLTDKRKRVLLSLSHRFSQTLTFDFSGSTQLSQSFYLKYDENPRDQDQLDTSLNARISSSPFKKVTVNLSALYSSSQFVNIDSTQSDNNRTRDRWELRPGFNYYMNDYLVITQTYGLSFEYTEYAFKETENFLDRNLTFSNEFVVTPTPHVRLRFKYDLLLHDSGSYLPDPVTGVDELDVTAEDRRDATMIRLDYQATKRIAFFAENQYSRSEDRVPATDALLSRTTDGQVQVGTNVNYDWGQDRRLRLLVSRVKRFSPFGVEAQNDYWDARSEFSYAF